MNCLFRDAACLQIQGIAEETRMLTRREQRTVLFVKASTADVAVLYHQQEKNWRI